MNDVRLTGVPSLAADGRHFRPPPSKRSALLYYLAYQEEWVSRDDLLYLLYSDLDEPAGRSNLRPLLSRIRRMGHVQELDVEPTRVRWRTSTDVGAFHEAVRGGRPDRAVEHYHGDLLASFSLTDAPEFDAWLDLERHALRREWRRSVATFAARLTRDGRHGEAAALVERLVRADALDEEVLRWRLVLLARAGRPGEALDAYGALVDALAREVDGVPEAETTFLVERIRSGSVPTADPFGDVGAAASTPRVPRELPVTATSFVGREKEIREVASRLEGGDHRLLTLVGPGGIGKTRLALEVAARSEGKFADGAIFVGLEAVTTADGMISALADELGVVFVGGERPRDRLLEHVRSRSALLVLDNLEHLLDEVGLVTELLTAGPALKILATSRQRLGLRAESVHDVGGLGVPEGSVPGTGESDALTLLASAGLRARSDFRVDEDLPAAIRICRLLGGMPLAIEMAASWLRILSLGEVATELEHGIDLLHDEDRNGLARHHDMRTVFASSWERLSAPERRALYGLSVFRGGFDLGAAGEVADVGAPMLLALTDRSFLMRDPAGRFTQHPLLAQYVRERAEESKEVLYEARDRHARFFTYRMGSGEGQYIGRERGAVDPTWLPDLPNLREAWLWAADRGREDLLDSAASALTDLCIETGRHAQGIAAFTHAAERLPRESLVRGRILRHLGTLHNWHTEYEAAARVLEESIGIFREHDARHDEALALNLLSLSYAYSFRPSAEVRALWKRAVRLFRRAGDRYHEAQILADLAFGERDPAKREDLLRRSVRLFREVEGRFGITLSLYNLSICLCWTRGRYAEAHDHVAEAVEIERTHGLPFRLAWWRNWQGTVAMYRGGFAMAEACFREARTIGETLQPGFGRWEADHALWGLAQVAALRGEPQRAEELLQEALRSNERHPDPFALRTDFLAALAQVVLDAGRVAEASDLSLEAGHYLRDHRQDTYEHAWQESFCSMQLGEIALVEGDAPVAETHLRSALASARAWHLVPAILQSFVSFGRLSRLRADDELAAVLFSHAAGNPASLAASEQAARRELEALPPDLVALGAARAESASATDVAAALAAGDLPRAR